MKSRILIIAFFLTSYVSFVSSQVIETIRPPAISTSNRFVNTKKIKVQNLNSPVLLDPRSIASQPKWDISLSQHGINHSSDMPKNLMDSIKLAGSILRKNREMLQQDTVQDEALFTSRMDITPKVNASFKGNAFNFWAPPDNSLAVSDDGYVVSVVNSSIYCMDVNGNVLLEENFANYLDFLNLAGGYFDPRVIYDPLEDKFIFVVLNGNTPATSTVVIGFSSSSNPMDQWWVYTFSGDPEGLGIWLDYPSIGISTNDFYVSGNQFTPDNNFRQALIYQLKKGPGFTGQNLTGTSFTDVRDAYGVPDFTIMPISFGFDGSVGPGIYFISTDSGGGTEGMMYYTDNDSDNNPNMPVFSFQVPNYYVPFNTTMLGTTDELKTNDCKTQSGFYADGTIHFAFDTRGDDLHTKVYYCRLNTIDLTNTSVEIGLQPFDYAFPSVAPFSTSLEDKSVLIGFLRTSSAIYPEFRTIVCDHNMNFSNSVLVKEGNGFVNFDAGTKERWGDYSGISRRNSANGPEVWISGCYGSNLENGQANVLTTWIAQITGDQTGAAPIANFTADHTAIMAGQTVTFSDLSSNQPTGWTWTFPGGTPGNSNQQNPVVTYDQEGVYDVILTATNAIGNDAETKVGYIVVSPSVQPPIADFTSDITNVAEGGTVRFQDLTANTPNKWQWFFPGGTPSLSDDQNPVIMYTEEGCHNVTLNVWNPAGVDVITKTCYIDVLTAVTDEDTIFNKFVVYPNPVSTGKLNIEFETSHPTELDFTLVDEQGRLVRNLIHRVVKSGLNNLAFNTDPLSPGLYYLLIHDKQFSLIKSEKFIVIR